MRNPLINIRFGFAANSSSSHSIIFLDKNHKLSDNYNNLEFGWDDFILVSKEAKLDYISVILKDSLLKNKLPEKMVDSIVRDWTGSSNSIDGYIDHQSQIRLPLKDGYVDIEFFEDFKNFLCRNDIAILGGNDNQDQNLVDKIPNLGVIELDFISPNNIYKKNEITGVWTIFNPSNGNKIKFSFNDISNKEIEEKSDTPELVDLKITDYCPFSCQYCYQSSTVNGIHAKFQHLKQIAKLLKDFGTFEVAIGGGEPTLYFGTEIEIYDKGLNSKDFNDVINLFYEKGIVVNFTTRNFKWLENLNLEQAAKIGCVALSIDKSNNLYKINELINKNKNLKNKIAVQYIVGISEKWNLEQMLRICGENNYKITLLGYKRFGFGHNVSPNEEEESEWVTILAKVLEKHPNLKISIDTVLAAISTKNLDENGVPKFCYATKDGINSMYIDVVKQKIARSSYDKETININFENYDNYDFVINNFRKWM